ncbi:hypothetical protein KW807_01740 [Candidatus Parcubacteria bacterium]|nr:hypothetical protein [Candidatus Parcubacteria bacterium]
MNITEDVSFDKEGRVERYPWLSKFYLALVITLVATLSFGLGRLSKTGDRAGVTLEVDQQLTTNDPQPNPKTQGTASAIQAGLPAETSRKAGEVVASKNGSKYHYPYCSGAKRILEANKLTFPSAQAAEASGYTLAANCSPK